MNYIEVIKAVWKWYQSSILEPNDYCLMMRLIAISNDDMGWEDCFLRNNYELIGSTKLSYKQIHHSRNKLQQIGLISFDQRNGLANAKYKIHYEALLDLSKKGKAEGKVRERLGKGEGVVKLNKTKLNNSFSGGKKPPTQKKDYLVKNLYWKSFIETFEIFYRQKKEECYAYMAKDWGCLDKIYKFLKKRAEVKNNEWTQELMNQSFNFFLKKAYEKDDWLKKNFSIPNILSQFNQITNGNSKTSDKTNTTAKRGGSIDELQSLKRGAERENEEFADRPGTENSEHREEWQEAEVIK